MTSPRGPLRDRLLPLGAALVVVAAAVGILALVNSARDKGLSALEEAKAAEISAAADSRDHELANILTATSALAAQPWEFTIGSASDQQTLESYRSPTARTGFFLLDASNKITGGVLLEGNVVGSTYDHAGLADALASKSFRAGQGAILPVGQGLTTDVPVFVVVLPVIDRTTGTYRGSFVAEIDVSPDSFFNADVVHLARHRTDEVMVADSNNVILAASKSELLATVIDPSLQGLASGLHRSGGRVVAVADIPTANWRLFFVQSESEFDDALSQPLQDAGRVLVLLLLGLAAVVFLVLVRRLRAAREEQARLRQLNATQEEFVSIVSHELRTPVAGILGFLQTGLDHWDELSDDDKQASVRRAAISARRLQALTRDVLDAESVETGRMSFVFEPVDLADEVRSAVEAAESLQVAHHYSCDVPAGRVTVNADADRIQQVMTNLLDNAVKNSPPDSVIDIRLTVHDRHARVAVVDAGPGFDSTLGTSIFDKFVRGRGSSVTGTGLGLYVSRLVIEAHRGTIAAGQGPDGRTEISFELPVLADGEGA